MKVRLASRSRAKAGEVAAPNTDPRLREEFGTRYWLTCPVHGLSGANTHPRDEIDEAVDSLERGFDVFLACRCGAILELAIVEVWPA